MPKNSGIVGFCGQKSITRATNDIFDAVFFDIRCIPLFARRSDKWYTTYIKVFCISLIRSLKIAQHAGEFFCKNDYELLIFRSSGNQNYKSFRGGGMESKWSPALPLATWMTVLVVAYYSITVLFVAIAYYCIIVLLEGPFDSIMTAFNLGLHMAIPASILLK